MTVKSSQVSFSVASQLLTLSDDEFITEDLLPLLRVDVSFRTGNLYDLAA